MKIPYKAKLTGSIKQALAGLQGYDIMALELIQNATDAGADKIIFDVCDNELKVYNDKEFSSCGLNQEECAFDGEKMCDFHAISEFASGHKSTDSKYIGRFGIGFVSVYQITDEPIIRSSGKEMKLNPLSEESEISDITEEFYGTCFSMPWVKSYSNLRKKLGKSGVGESICDDVLQGIEEVGEKCLFFLKGLEEIEVLRNGELIKNFIIKKRNNHVTITAKCNKSGKIKREKYFVFDGVIDPSSLEKRFRHLKENSRNNDIQVAVPLNHVESYIDKGLIFAYLPTAKKTNMPIHINGDFFPETNRKQIILSGEDHERYWNFALLEGAAELIANNLQSLRDELNYKDFWYLLSSIYYRSQNEFKFFGDNIKIKAEQFPCIYTDKEEWVLPSEACLVDNDEINSRKQKALSELGFDIVNSDISHMVNFLKIKSIDMHSFVETLEVSKGKFQKNKELLKQIYSIADKLCKGFSIDDDIITNFVEINIIAYKKGLLSIKEMYRLPNKIEAKSLPSILSGLPIVDKKFKKYSNLYKLFDELDFEYLGIELSSRLENSETAEELIGTDTTKIKKFYNFLSEYPSPKNNGEWESVHFLFSNGNFYPADKVNLPSEFTDPFNKFNTLEEKTLNADTIKFFTKVFKIKKQSSKEYIKEDLKRDLEEQEEITDELYEKILLELVSNHKKIVRNTEGIRDLLSGLELVKVEDGSMKKASECYLKTSRLEKLLGDDKKNWLDAERIPSKIKKSAIELFQKLGLSDDKKIQISHIVERVNAISKEKPTLQNRKIVQTIIEFLADNKNKYKDNMREFWDIEWLPREFQGKIDDENWCKPEDLFHPRKAKAFSNSKNLLGMDKSLDLFEDSKKTFWEAIGIRLEPRMDEIINHIIYCRENKEALDSDVYEIMRKLYTHGKYEDVHIEQLKDMACIYDKENGRYLNPAKCFSQNTKFLNHRYTLPTTLFDRNKNFFKSIGVRENPDTIDFANVILEIDRNFATSYSPPEIEKIKVLYFYCLQEISKGVEKLEKTANDAIDLLKSEQSILLIDETFSYPHLAFISSDDKVRNDFEGELDKYIANLECDRIETIETIKIIKVFDKLGVASISNVLHEIISLVADDKKEELKFNREISSKFLRALSYYLHEKEIKYKRVLDIFQEIKFYSVDNLKTQYEFSPSDKITIYSDEKEKYAFYDIYENEVYIDREKEEKSKAIWRHIFLAIFSRLSISRYKPISEIDLAAIVENPQRELDIMKEHGYEEPEEIEIQKINIDILNNTQESDITEGQESKVTSQESEIASNANDVKIDIGSKDDSERRYRRFGNRMVGGAGNGKQRQSGGSGSSRVRQSSGSGNSGGVRRTRIGIYAESKNSPHRDGDPEINKKIDRSAIEAVMKDLNDKNFKAEERDHYNEGYDIMANKDGEKRIIEVKGLYNEWTEKGVFLSQSQLELAYREKENFWLYVVESTKTSEPEISRIRNPFALLDKFGFDFHFKKFSEECE